MTPTTLVNSTLACKAVFTAETIKSNQNNMVRKMLKLNINKKYFFQEYKVQVKGWGYNVWGRALA